MASKSPVLLSPEQRDRLSGIPEDLTEAEIARYYTLNRQELALIKSVHRENWLGFGVQVGVLHFPGMAWRDLPGVPMPVLTYLAEQIGCDTAEFNSYAQGENTGDEHLDRICASFGYRKWRSSLTLPICRALLPAAMESDHALSLMEKALAHLRGQKILVPAISTVEGVTWLALRAAERTIYRRLVAVLNEQQREALTKMLQTEEELKGHTRLHWLRRPAKKPSSRSLRQILLRIIWLDELALPALPDNVPLNRARLLARRSARYKAQPLAKFKPLKHQALLFCYLTYLRRDLIDQSVEMFGAMKTDLWSLGRKRQDEHVKQHAATANQNLIILTDAMEAFLIAERDRLDPFQAVFGIASRETLQGIIDANRQIARPPDMSVFDLVEERYEDIRVSWLKWFTTLVFRPTSGYHAGIRGLRHVVLLRKHRLRVTEIVQRLNAKQVVRAPLDHISSKRWRKLILHDATIKPNFYELSAFENLHTGLLSGQIAVQGSYRFQAFDSYLIPYDRWQDIRDSGQTRIAITGDFQTHLDNRLVLLQEKVDAVTEALANKDSGLSVDENGTFKLSRPERTIPASTKRFQKHVDRYFPQADLPDAVIDVDEWTGCLSDFTNLDTGEPAMGDEKLVVIAALMALGMNMSFHRMAMATPFTYKQLVSAATWYIRDETLIAAQNRLDTFILRQPISALWGRGTTVSSDGMRFPVVANAAHTQHNPHFLGLKRGTSLYTHTADIWGSLGQQLVPPNAREALFSIDVLENHSPEFHIVEHYTDTNGFTRYVFAISPMLGYRFAPRIRDLFDQSLVTLPGLRVEPPLKALFKKPANVDLVDHLWDDMLWGATSIRYGTVSASLFMRKLITYPRRSQLSKALIEFGKIEETIHILTYCVDEQLERRTEGGLNKGESIQGMARATFSGQRGELHTADFQEQYHRTSSLMFLVTLMCAWNTVYLHQIREYFGIIGDVTDPLVWQHVSPARWKHFNMIGHYAFDLKQAHSLHHLRDLRLNALEQDDDDMD